MVRTNGYASPGAVVAALAQAGKNQKKELLTTYLRERLLARLVAHDSQKWVLKGGTAMLLRIPDTRATQDIDVAFRGPTIDEAITQFREALAIQLGDHVNFTVRRTEDAGNNVQAYVDGVRLVVDATVGTKKVSPVKIDLVVGSIMVFPPENLIVHTVLEPFTDFEMPTYSVVDHIADKVCATQAQYGLLRSSRVRDLFDIIAFALTTEVEGTPLVRAIEREWKARDLQGPPDFIPPPDWQKVYEKLRKKSAKSLQVPDFEDSVELAEEFVRRAAHGLVRGMVWSPRARAWEDGTAAPR